MTPHSPPRRFGRYLKKGLTALAWLGLLSLICALTGESVPPSGALDAQLGRFTAGQRFNWTAWEVKATLDEAGWWLQGRPVESDIARQKEIVLAYLERQRQIDELNRRIEQAYAQSLTDDVAPLEADLAHLRTQQAAETAEVERILADQVEQVLLDEGLGRGKQVWPPVTFRFTELPTYLIISPRDEIKVERGIHLQPGMTPGQRSELEAEIEANLDVSALVDNVGGIGSWPTMVIQHSSLAVLFDIIAHEWSHNYFQFKPLGANYNASRDMTTINETAASIIGEEVSHKALARFYPELLPPPEPETPPAAEASLPDEETEETFSQAMRRIRLQVDSLLAEGKVAEAETFMERERQRLAENGHYLRRLNQAYFAFHGSYASGPSSVDPIGPWTRQLREQSGSLKNFTETIAQIQTLDDLLYLIDEKVD